MTTISQLPSADDVSSADLLPISQAGLTHAVSIGALLAETQPAIIVQPSSLLGRTSIGAGGPDSIAIGAGLTLSNGTLSAAVFDPEGLALHSGLAPGDHIMVISSGALLSVELAQIRELFTAGANVTIDADGVIAASGSGGASVFRLTTLSPIVALASQDLIAVSKGGQDHTISYSNLIDGITIDQAGPAGLAADGDALWVSQSNNIMLRQTLGALWPWMSGKMSLRRRTVIELRANTTLDALLHNNALLVCSGSIVISAVSSNLGTGFACELLNVSAGSVTLSAGILTSNGSGLLSSSQCCSIFCVTYSAGTIIYATVGGGSSAVPSPGQVSGLVSASVNSTTILVSWSAPTAGGPVSAYSVQYRVTGTPTWLAAGQSSGATNFAMTGLQPMTSYDVSVSALNTTGPGVASATITVATLATAALPGAPTGITATNITSSSMSCGWIAPTIGGALVYGVQYRVSGQSAWNSAVANLSATTCNITSLMAATSYDIQIVASGSLGSGPPSVLATFLTLPVSGLVTSITWNLVPIGSFAHGVGAIGVNAHVNPVSSAVRFGFSPSPTSPPTTWIAAVQVNSDLWGVYAPTPAAAGTWYAWAEGIDGSAPTVYPTPFTVT
jgi:hypothetical protein